MGTILANEWVNNQLGPKRSESCPGACTSKNKSTMAAPMFRSLQVLFKVLPCTDLTTSVIYQTSHYFSGGNTDLRQLQHSIHFYSIYTALNLGAHQGNARPVRIMQCPGQPCARLQPPTAAFSMAGNGRLCGGPLEKGAAPAMGGSYRAIHSAAANGPKD